MGKVKVTKVESKASATASKFTTIAECLAQLEQVYGKQLDCLPTSKSAAMSQLHLVLAYMGVPHNVSSQFVGLAIDMRSHKDSSPLAEFASKGENGWQVSKPASQYAQAAKIGWLYGKEGEEKGRKGHCTLLGVETASKVATAISERCSALGVKCGTFDPEGFAAFKATMIAE